MANYLCAYLFIGISFLSRRRFFSLLFGRKAIAFGCMDLLRINLLTIVFVVAFSCFFRCLFAISIHVEVIHCFLGFRIQFLWIGSFSVAVVADLYMFIVRMSEIDEFINAKLNTNNVQFSYFRSLFVSLVVLLDSAKQKRQHLHFRRKVQKEINETITFHLQQCSTSRIHPLLLSFCVCVCFSQWAHNWLSLMHNRWICN